MRITRCHKASSWCISHHCNYATSASSNAILNKLAVVLARPQGPQNVGSAARICRNFNIQTLRIVDPHSKQVWPEGGPISQEAYAFATSADDILRATEQSGPYATVEDACHDCTTIIATSARQPRPGYRFVSAREAAGLITGTIHNDVKNTKVAVLFGNERTGLKSDEYAFASHVAGIPSSGVAVNEDGTPLTGGSEASMNLSHAIAIMCYELFVSAGDAENAKLVAKHDRHGPPLETRAKEELKAKLVGAMETLTIRSARAHQAEEGSQAGAAWQDAHQQMWASAAERILSMPNMPSRSAKVLFTLAKRVIAVGRMNSSLGGSGPFHESASNFLLQYGATEHSSRDEIRSILRHRFDVGLETMEVDALLETIKAS